MLLKWGFFQHYKIELETMTERKLKQPMLEGNTNATKHNGEAAVKAIQHGQALTGPARDAELAVYTELANEGRPAIVTRTAVRLQAACDLFWAALVDAGERGDLQALDRYVARFGWLAGASLRAWAQVRDEEKDAPDGLDYERILEGQKDESR